MNKSLRYVFSTLGLALIALIAFFGTAAAAAAVAPADSTASLLDLFTPVYQAFASGKFAYAVVLAVIGIVAVTRRYGGAWAQTSLAGSAMAVILSTATALASALASGGALTFQVFESALMIGAGASGIFELTKNLIVDPLIRPLQAKAPAWLQPAFSVLLFIYDGNGGDSAAVIAASEAVGAAAVVSKPGNGVSDVVGKATEIK